MNSTEWASDTTGVYVITCDSTGKQYVGSSSLSIRQRWHQHRRDLRHGNHHSRHMQNAWNKYGESSFTFEVIERCASERCLDREQFWIDALRPDLNVFPSARSPIGNRHSPETLAKMSAAARERWARTPRFCQKGHELGHENNYTVLYDKRRVCRACYESIQAEKEARQERNRAVKSAAKPKPTGEKRSGRRGYPWTPEERELRGVANLTPEQVRAIQFEYVPLKVTQKQLAQKYGVSQRVVHEIIRGYYCSIRGEGQGRPLFVWKGSHHSLESKAKMSATRTGRMHEACKRGHPFDSANTYIDPQGLRHCHLCRSDAALRLKRRSTQR